MSHCPRPTDKTKILSSCDKPIYIKLCNEGEQTSSNNPNNADIVTALNAIVEAINNLNLQLSDKNLRLVDATGKVNVADTHKPTNP